MKAHLRSELRRLPPPANLKLEPNDRDMRCHIHIELLHQLEESRSWIKTNRVCHGHTGSQNMNSKKARAPSPKQYFEGIKQLGIICFFDVA